MGVTLQRRLNNMDNQHRKIAGYRELSQEEIDLMNEIKFKGKQLVNLILEVKSQELCNTDMDAERVRWATLAKDNTETGVMQLVRAVALPT